MVRAGPGSESPWMPRLVVEPALREACARKEDLTGPRALVRKFVPLSPPLVPSGDGVLGCMGEGGSEAGA